MRWVRRILIGLLALVVVLGVFLFFLVRRSFPQIDGQVKVPGVDSQVEVIRDTDGVPHIYASDAHDLFFAEGFVHAQDRFWQMDFWRHIGSARLSEMFGESQVDTDEFLRAMGFAEAARTEFELMDPGTRDILQWYADGVNAYLAGHRGSQLSLEYGILPLQTSGYQPEPWTPANTLTWAKMMSWDLSGNMGDEIARAVLSADLPIDRIEQLYPGYPSDHPVIVPDDDNLSAQSPPFDLPEGAITALASAGAGAQAVWDLTGGGFEGIGSNNWVIGGSRTDTGMPILANDPHLAIQMPSIWYEVGLHCVETTPDCPYQMVGFSFAGTPGIIIGHNNSIAWGVTNEAVDTQDLFIERLNPDNPDQYEVNGEWVDMDVHDETIVVAGGDDVTYQVRSTRHGPIVSGLYFDEDLFDGTTLDTPEDYAVSLSWQTLQPSTVVEAILGIDTATDYDEFRQALSKWDIAAQNVVYADTSGNIAYQSTGEIPIRANGDGRWPVPGWTDEYEWIGFVPFDDMPRMYDPGRDFVESANQPVTAEGSAPFYGYDGNLGYRAARIEEMIKTGGRHTVTDVESMQMDTKDGGAPDLVPYLLDVESDKTAVTEIQNLLSKWSEGDDAYQAAGDSAGAAAYEAVWANLLRVVFEDELPEDYWPEGGGRWFQVVDDLLAAPDDLWWDDVGTPEVENRDEMLTRAMLDAHDQLVDLLGDNPDRWAWGKLHRATFENQTLGQSGIAPIEWLFNRSAPARLGGGADLVDAVGFYPPDGYVVDWLPSMRMVVDLSDLSRSTTIHTTGQSGHAFNRHYDDMIEQWTDGTRHPMRWTREQVLADAEGTLVLRP